MTAAAPVLFVITTTDFGGTESYLEQLVAGLDRRRFLPLVCSLCPPGRVAGRIAATGVTVETLGMAARPRPHQLLAGAFRLARLCERRGVRLVHSLLYRGNVVAALACRLARRPPVLIWGQHCQIDTSESWWAATAARWALPRADRVVAVAEAVKEALVAAGHAPRDRVTVIANGVDVERYRPPGPPASDASASVPSASDASASDASASGPSASGPSASGPSASDASASASSASGPPGTAGAADLPDGAALRAGLGLGPTDLVVGAAGRLAPEKGLTHLLAAVALARDRGLPIELLLAGDGPERAALAARAGGLGIAGHVRFLGFQRQLEAVYPAFDVFALPSLEEASPLALLEAMACARAVVAAAVGGVPEILDGGRCGLLVPPADPEALAAALCRMATQPALRRDLGAAARARVLAAYGLPAMVRRHQQLYLSLLPPV